MRELLDREEIPYTVLAPEVAQVDAFATKLVQ